MSGETASSTEEQIIDVLAARLSVKSVVVHECATDTVTRISRMSASLVASLSIRYRRVVLPTFTEETILAPIGDLMHYCSSP